MGKALHIDKELLGVKIQESGLKIGFICEQLGMSRQGFWKKANGLTPFRVSEVFVLCSLLNISEEDKIKIFYPETQLVSC